MRIRIVAASLAAAMLAGVNAAAQPAPEPPPAPAPAEPPRPELTPEPTTRYGEACLLAAQRTLVGRYDFGLEGVEDWTPLGEREVWILYTATNKETQQVFEEDYGCLFVDLADPAKITLEAVRASGRPLGEGAVGVLNQDLAAAGFGAVIP